MKTTKKCALCDKIIDDKFVVCREHLQDYRENKDTEWMKVLIAMQKRQWEVDVEERLIRQKQNKNVRPYRRLTRFDKQAINILSKKGLGYVNIGKVLGLNENTIKTYLRSGTKRKRPKT